MSEQVNKLQQMYNDFKDRISKMLEPRPVLFEGNPEIKSVGAFCEHPQIGNTQKNVDDDQPFRHSPNYNPTLSPNLQKLFHENYAKNKQNKDQMSKITLE
eukprot:167017_1